MCVGVGLPACTAGRPRDRKKKNRTGGGGKRLRIKIKKTPDKLDNKRTSEQTGLTAGSWSAEKFVKNTKTEGGEAGEEEEEDPGGG